MSKYERNNIILQCQAEGCGEHFSTQSPRAKYCEECRKERKRERDRERVRSPEQRKRAMENKIARVSRQRKERREEGVCTKCCKELTDKKFVQCKECRDKEQTRRNGGARICPGKKCKTVLGYRQRICNKCKNDNQKNRSRSWYYRLSDEEREEYLAKKRFKEKERSELLHNKGLCIRCENKLDTVFKTCSGCLDYFRFLKAEREKSAAADMV